MSTTLLNYHDVNTIQLHVGLYKPKRVIKSKIVKKKKQALFIQQQNLLFIQ